MERKEPNDESLDAYVNAIEQAMLKLDERAEKRPSRSVSRVEKALEQPYLRLISYDASFIDMNSLEKCVETVSESEQKASVEVDMAQAGKTAAALENALKQLRRQRPVQLKSPLVRPVQILQTAH